MNYRMKRIPVYQFMYMKDGQKLVGGFTFQEGDNLIEKADKVAGELGAEFWWDGRVMK